MKLLSVEQSEPQQNECQTKNQLSGGEPLLNKNDYQVKKVLNINGVQSLDTSNEGCLDLTWLIEAIKRQTALEQVSKAKKIKKFQLKLKRKQKSKQMRLLKKIAFYDIAQILLNI
ncbi:unnamed protein product (macronuclear) [Paramecium tetraurelia]|uniref:Uncharacterized protein n=1 Tax=Paramecium tetraurelia TaxID=5888 RepID=A0DVR5_PARTE|nr:uncharacterized protein GSPATT00020785001 [Paramecium tetraurelia]CAK87132.1 unnamed protein product [Paramecium tetraurelia]|eukprot:XP_001454529.1 hypothetical protein (macronuclear) [Paramecium tetraurelia strain d4-2]